MTSPEPLQRWLFQRRPAAAQFPYAAVVDAYQRHGKHLIPDQWTELLTATRNRLPEVRGIRHSPLAAFLTNALDKTDGRYDYRTYLSLNLLPLAAIDGAPASAARLLARRDRLHVQLLTDVIRFELRAIDGATAPLPQLRPESRLVTKRIRHALRAAQPALHRLRLIEETPYGDHREVAQKVLAAVDLDLATEEQLVLTLSMLPVWTVHDEWMFIRILQTFEATFALLAVDLHAIIAAVDAGRPQQAAARLSAAATLLRESAPLWSLMATLQPEAFQRFRPYTEGASAIQSRNYKLVEALCRRPSADRLDSSAYLSVPEVRDRIIDGQPGLDDALAAAQYCNRTAGTSALAVAMKEFAGALHQWRHTHYRLAVRMLGSGEAGTGYTEGTPYLARIRDQPIFEARCHPLAKGMAMEN
ncbi:tryptophan 2,3-dioxygenase family protein [Micromonospora sp. NPDC048894]|uniref:tryptophan 2,3-dioxygenase family protein n=1 Tax=Micromonospora sp. NPDC048894 TaxID=3155493 RepID=UPI003406DF4D